MFDLSTEFTAVSGNYFFYVPVPVLILVLVVLVGFLILNFTRYGRYVYGVGGNELAARVSGINSRFIIGFTFVISGLLAGLAGVDSPCACKPVLLLLESATNWTR